MKTPHQTAPQAVPFGESCIVLDVRTGLEHAEVALQSPHQNVPLGELDPTRFLQDNHIRASQPVYVLCRGGKRATAAAESFIAAGHDNVHVIEGGIIACEAAGIPLRKGGKEVMSLERQVRIAAGLLIVSGAVLGALVSPAFYALSAFVGAGLIFAGVTDKCGMALMLAKAPWNKNLEQPGHPAAANCTATPPPVTDSCCAGSALPADESHVKMPDGTVFYSPGSGKPAPLHVHKLTKTGASAGGCA
jgi:rhodanese-related sulfurtransferase